MTTQTEALKMALEFVEANNYGGSDAFDLITAIKEALAQPEQEPVAFYRCNGCGHEYQQMHPTSCDCMKGSSFEQVNYYTTPPQRTWVGLTDDDKVLYPYPPAKPPLYATAKNTKSVRDGYELGGYEKEAGYYSEQQLDEFAKTIEAKLKEKNT